MAPGLAVSVRGKACHPPRRYVLDMAVRLIDAAATRDLRRRVLRPHQPPEAVVYPADDDRATRHLGFFDADTLLAVASLYVEPLPGAESATHYRLRGMAVEPDRQAGGVGRELVEACVEVVRAAGGSLIWCNARQSAAGFYDKLGFTRQGDVFEIEGVGPHYVMSRVV